MDDKITAPAGRDVRLDGLKALAILAVLITHCASAGYSFPLGSFNWCSSVLWASLTRFAVPVFFMCSGAIMLDPDRQLPLRRLFTRYLPRLLVALVVWAAAYKAVELYRATGSLTPAALVQGLKELVLFKHQFHLYYLHITLLLYLFLPVLRPLAAAPQKTLRYALLLWLAFGILWPGLVGRRPFSLMSFVPKQAAVSMTYSAFGYALAGFYIKKYARLTSRTYLIIFVLSTVAVFGGTVALSLRAGELYTALSEGMSPLVALMSCSLFACFMKRRPRESRVPGLLARASFCIYLTHVFFLDIFIDVGFTSALFAPALSVPVCAAAALACSLIVWLTLSRIPLVRRYLI